VVGGGGGAPAPAAVLCYVRLFSHNLWALVIIII